MKLLLRENQFVKLINVLTESFIPEETAWMWVSPENKVHRVPKLHHQQFIERVYRDKDYSWDYDRVFDQALKDGWVRCVYEKDVRSFYSELSVNGYSKKRVVSVLRNVFGDLIKYGHKSVYVDYENPRESFYFSTSTNENKRKLMAYVNS